MKTYSGSNAGSQIEPVIWNAKEYVWLISPWLGKNYAQRLAELSQKGIEIRLITGNNDYNIESLEILKASENPNLRLIVLDKEKATFVHSKIYLVDKKYGISGSANFTYSGLNSNVESLSIAETMEEVQKIENDFMRMWMDFEREGMSTEELSRGTSYSISSALPLLKNFADINQPNIISKQLFYHPYYFFEFSFRASAGKSPPIIFDRHGFVVIDAVTRQIVEDQGLNGEINDHPIENYVLKTENKYRLEIIEPKIGEFREARELALTHIIKKNTQHYKQYYRSGAYDRIFVPYRNIIRFIKSGFVQLPIWYIEMHEPNGLRHQDILFGSSGKKWNELLYCSECQKKIWISNAIACQVCGKRVCPGCIQETGIIFKKKLCRPCQANKP